jgi:hypothetical protein
LRTLQIFLAALDAVEVLGPTEPESWAEQHVEKMETAATKAEAAWRNFIFRDLGEQISLARTERLPYIKRQ